MSTAYKGRHAGGPLRTPAADKAHAQTRPPGRFHTLRRPVASAAAILAVAGISAASSSEALPHDSGPAFTASPMAVAQAVALSQDQTDTNVALAAARRSGVQRASALTHAQKAAADASARAHVLAAAELVRTRAAGAERVAREKSRQGLIDRAQSDPKAVGRLLAADRGWGASEFSCLESLWTKESGWRWNANNSSSGAYGIPQSLPGSKMASAGSDWATNPVTQIKWGLGYIANRYGTPCGAWAKSQASNWY
jgi:hypothetical protein